jgi:hypothetical protein
LRKEKLFRFPVWDEFKGIQGHIWRQQDHAKQVSFSASEEMNEFNQRVFSGNSSVEIEQHQFGARRFQGS